MLSKALFYIPTEPPFTTEANMVLKELQMSTQKTICYYNAWWCTIYNGFFRGQQILRPCQLFTKIKNANIYNFCIFMNIARCEIKTVQVTSKYRLSHEIVMSLLNYFSKKKSSLPNSNGPLSERIPSSSIVAANKEVLVGMAIEWLGQNAKM